MVDKNLKKYGSLFKEYTELRMQENRSGSISLLKGNLVSNYKTATSGVSARVFKNGSWGFASNPELDSTSIEAVVKAATSNAVFLNDKSSSGEILLPKTTATSENDFSTGEKRKDQKSLIDFTREVDDYISKKYSSLSSRTVVLNYLDMEKALLTSDESSSFSMIPRSFFVFMLSTEKNGEPVEIFDLAGGLGQLEDNFKSPSDLFPKIDQLHEQLMHKKDGVYAQAGSKECILDADLAGVLAHEAIGHTTEADLVLGGSIAGDFINQQVASPLITLVDYANTAFGKTCPVPVYIDDEGTEAKDATIIENGILKSFMHSKDTARKFSVEPTGNARAYQFSDEPIIRMRNTAIVPGKDKLEKMISSIDDGYYLLKHSNGQADSTSEFTFTITFGYEIKNGKLGRAIKDTTISGIAFDMLKSITMVSDNIKWASGGMCGKKQRIPVGMGGPAVKCRINIGGR